MGESELPRRVFMQGTAAAAISMLGVSPVTAQGFTKSPQQSAGYQDHPNGDRRCGNCMQFQPPSSCKVVAGRISANGWCRIYAAKQG
jgi:hypothetical protein